MNCDNFLEDLRIECKKNNVKLSFPDCDFVKLDGYDCFGYFESHGDEGTLVVAKKVNKKDFFETLVHESCHMDQWIEKSKEWEVFANCAEDSDERLHLWARCEISLKQKQVENYFDKYVNVEIDCEKRTVEKIKKYNLNIDTKRYIQKVNAFILFQRAILQKYRIYKRQKGNVPPYALKALVDQMPTRFVPDYSKVSRRLQKIFDSFYKFNF
jgi:hypothetical protein